MSWRRGTLDVAKWLAERAGLHVVPAWRRPNEAFADHLARLFRLCDIDCVLDVGANEGQFRDFLRLEVGYDGAIVSYEPIAELAVALREKARADSSWHVHAEAVGTDNEAHLFSVMADRQFSSFLPPDSTNYGGVSTLNAVERQVEVRTRTLQAAVKTAKEATHFERLYLKLDTQGYDLTILQAGQLALGEIRALQTEASVKPIYAGAPTFSDVFAWLEGAGFDLSGVFPNNEGHFPIMVEFDAVFIDRRLVRPGGHSS